MACLTDALVEYPLEPTEPVLVEISQARGRSNRPNLAPRDMMTEIYLDNRELTEYLRLMHETCEKHNDIATASLIENWVDQAERRSWFLAEITREV